MKNNYIDDSKGELSDTVPAREGKVTELHLLSFAKVILFVVAILYVLAAISELIWNGNSVYEVCKITLPSLAMLVIGYYFGTRANG
jgi:hypothetical protein